MWQNPEIPTDLVIFTEEILNQKLHFFCSVSLAHFSKELMKTNTY